MSEAIKQSRTAAVLGYVLGFMVLVAITLQTWGVFSRNVLGSSTAWIDDIQRMNFIWLIWICGGLAYGGRGLIGLDLVQSKFVNRPRAYHALTTVQTLIELAFSSLFVYLAYQMLATQFRSGETTTVLTIPLWLLNLGFLIGCVLLFAFGIRKLLRAINDIRLLTPVDSDETAPKEA